LKTWYFDIHGRNRGNKDEAFLIKLSFSLVLLLNKIDNSNQEQLEQQGWLLVWKVPMQRFTRYQRKKTLMYLRFSAYHFTLTGITCLLSEGSIDR
jgi:hypothetical protein